MNPMPNSPIIPLRAKPHLPAIDGAMHQKIPDPLKRGRKTRRETMKTMLLAATAALTLGAGAAYAGDGEGPAANTYFTELPGVVAQADVPNAPVYAEKHAQPQAQVQTQAQSGQGSHFYVTNSSKGTWLFAPDSNAGANS
jgi:hypothetical protein